MSAAIDLSEFEAAFSGAEAASGGSIPDGTYRAKLAEVKLGRLGDRQLPAVLWTFETPEGRKIFKNSFLSEKSMPYLKGDLKTLGVNINALSELPAYFPAMQGLICEVVVKTKGDNTNIYINKVLAGSVGAPAPQPAPAPAMAGATAGPATEDDLPF